MAILPISLGLRLSLECGNFSFKIHIVLGKIKTRRLPFMGFIANLFSVPMSKEIDKLDSLVLYYVNKQPAPLQLELRNHQRAIGEPMTSCSV